MHNDDDAIGSIANYLKQHGWHAGEAIVTSSPKTKGSLRPIALVGEAHPSRYAMHNFKVITTYNTSDQYAMAVAELAAALKGA